MSGINGRPTDYTEELAEEICETVAGTSKGLVPLCEENIHWPRAQTIRRWIRQNSRFCSMYAQAKLDQADLLVEECMTIADNATNDSLFVERDGETKEMCNSEWINRSRLRVDTRKWVAARLAPRIYGDKATQHHDVTIRQEDAIKDLE
jgi:hypothetical protein